MVALLTSNAAVSVHILRNHCRGWDAELQLVGILISRIPDISGGKPGHFQIVSINLTILDQKGYKNNSLCPSSTQNDYEWEENRTMLTFMPHIVTKFSKYMIRTFFTCKSGYRTKLIFLQLWKKFDFFCFSLLLINLIEFRDHSYTNMTNMTFQFEMF